MDFGTKMHRSLIEIQSKEWKNLVNYGNKSFLNGTRRGAVEGEQLNAMRTSFKEIISNKYNLYNFIIKQQIEALGEDGN